MVAEHGGGGGDADVRAERCAKGLRAYANDLAVRANLSEVEMRFGQRFGPGEAVTVLSLIVTSPVHLVTFGRIIAASIATYESRYGAIPAAEPRPTADPTG